MRLHKYIFFFFQVFFTDTENAQDWRGREETIFILLTFATDLSSEYLNLIEI